MSTLILTFTAYSIDFDTDNDELQNEEEDENEDNDEPENVEIENEEPENEEPENDAESDESEDDSGTNTDNSEDEELLNRLRFRRKPKTVTTKFKYYSPMTKLENEVRKTKDTLRKRTIVCRKIIREEKSAEKPCIPWYENEQEDENQFPNDNFSDNLSVRKDTQDNQVVRMDFQDTQSENAKDNYKNLIKHQELTENRK